MNNDNVGFQFITSNSDRETALLEAESLLKGGGRWIQLRLKERPETEIIETGRALLPLIRSYGGTLIVNDHPHLAKAIGADGVHMGKNDLTTEEARAILGPEAIIGRTANTPEDVARLCTEAIDYIGLGPYRWTSTKKNLSPILGLNGYSLILDRMKAEGVKLKPIVAIGGITPEDIPLLGTLAEKGLTGVAISSAISAAVDIENAARQFKTEIDRCFKQHKA